MKILIAMAHTTLEHIVKQTMTTGLEEGSINNICSRDADVVEKTITETFVKWEI